MILLILIYAIFASSFLFGQAALIYTQPIFLIGLRMVAAGLILLFYSYFKNRESLLKSIDKSLLIQLSIFHIFIPYVTEFWGLQYVGGAKTAILYSVSPFITALMDWFFHRTVLSSKKIAGLIIGFLGLVPVLMSCAYKECGITSLFILDLPELAILVSAVSSCYGWILLKRAINKGSSAFVANGSAMLMGGALALMASSLFESWNPVPTTNIYMTLFFVSLLILVGNVLYYNAYGFLLKKYSPTFLSFFGFTIPIFAGIYQWLFFGELVSLGFIFTMFFTFAGLALFYKAENAN